MIENLSEYFMPEHEFYLQSVSYNKIENITEQAEYSLNCFDSISADVEESEGVRVTVTRSLKFDPEEIFELSVSFGAMLKFEPEMRDKYKWDEINMAEELRNSGEFVIGNLMSRISLLIAQITSCFGQAPLVLPPGIAKEK